MIYEKFLYDYIAAGEKVATVGRSALSSDAAAYSADFKPTNQQKEVYTVLKDRLVKAQQAYQKILKEDLEQMNRTLTKEKIELIVPDEL